MDGLHPQLKHRRAWSALPRKHSSNGVSAPAAGDKPFRRDVFGWSRTQPPSASVNYAEIFGAFASSCSIPVLDLPPASDEHPDGVFSTSTLNYSEIFGGSEPCDLGLSYEDMLLSEKLHDGMGRDTTEKGNHFQKDIFMGPSIRDSSKYDAATHMNQFLLNENSTNFASKMENLRAGGYAEAGLLHRSKVRDFPISGLIYAADAPPVENEIPSEISKGFVGGDVVVNSLSASHDGTKKYDNEPDAKKHIRLKTSSPAEDILANEQYHSCSSSDKSSNENNSHIDISNYDHNSTVNSAGVSLEDVGSSKVLLHSRSSTKKLDGKLRVTEMHTASKSIIREDVHHSETFLPKSSMNQSSVSVDMFPSMAIGNLKNIDSGGAEKPSPLTSCVVEKIDGCQSNVFTVYEGKPSNKQPNLSATSSATTIYGERDSHIATFFSLSDINLRTAPSQVPPPLRPPPKLSGNQISSKVKMAVKEQNIKGAPEVKFSNEATKQVGSSVIDLQVNAVGAAAAASAAAMKEAMEQAEAKIRTAKELMERKKDGFHSRKKSLVNDTMKMENGIEGPVVTSEVTKEIDRSNAEVKITEASEKYHCENRTFKGVDWPKTTGVVNIATDYHDTTYLYETRPCYKDAVSSQTHGSYVHDQNVGMWKVGEQFFEFVNDEKDLKKIPEIPDLDSGLEREAYEVITETNSSDSKADKLDDLQNVNDDYLAFDTTSKLKKEQEPNGVSIFCKIKEEEAEHLGVSDVSVQGNIGKLEDPLDLPQQITDQEAVNAEKQKARNFGTCMHEDHGKESASSQICSCEGFSEGDAEGSNGKESIESCLLEDNHCDASEKNPDLNDDALNLQSAYKFFEYQECSWGLENPISGSCPDLNMNILEEELPEARDEADDHGQLEPTSETEVQSEKDEDQTPGETQGPSMHVADEGDASAVDMVSADSTVEGKNANANPHDKKKLPVVFPCSELEQEEHEKEPCWQYFSEITGKTASFDVGGENPILSNLYESKFGVISQTEGEGGYGDHAKNTVMGSEPEVIVEDKSACNFRDDNSLRASEKVSYIDDNDDIPYNGNKNISKENSIKVEKKASENRSLKEEEINIPRIIKNEGMKEEKGKRELEVEMERFRRLEEEREREREREKDRQALEGANRGAREGSLNESRERAAVEKATAEARRRALAEAREKAEKASNEALLLAEKASREAKLRAERAAVERATAEARERAVERALAEKAAQEAKERAEKSSVKDWQRKENGADCIRDDVGMKKTTSSSDIQDLRESQKYSNSSNRDTFHSNDKYGGPEVESAMRCKARLERHQRTVERAAKALAEKNLRDTLAQREQAERNRISETLDAEVRRWSSGKEGNLRALLSTLQYILGPESGWQPVPLTEVITAAAVKKAYRKATLCVHPDKLQQRGASIQQKYICEKVFDLLKEAWSRFNSEER